MHIQLRSSSVLASILPFVLFGFVGCGGNNPAGGGGDGTIYYATVDHEIWKLSLADGSINKLITGGEEPDRTPQNTFIYRLTDLDESADGNMVRTIVKSVSYPNGYNNSFVSPRLSPDGTMVAYQSLADNTYVVKRDSGQLVSSFPEAQNSTTGFERPSWTQDGRIVVAGGFSNPGLYISDAALSTFTRFDPMLASPSEPSVSPDGKRVAFIINGHVGVLNLDGTGFQQVTTGNGQESFPAWSPDGQKIAAWNVYTLITFNADGSGTLFDVGAAHPDMLYNFLSDLAFCWR